MKAAIYKGIKDVTINELAMPVCGENDIIVKNLYASICGSDISAYYHGGDSVRIFKGFEFGHEMVSEVVEVGQNVKGIEIGQRVYPYPLEAKNDRSRAATVGGFSEYIQIPNCELGKSVYLVSDKISSKVAALIEPFTVGSCAARKANPQPGQTAIVFGAGAIGVSAAIALKHYGIEKVMIADLSDFRLDKVKNLGFEVCNSAKEDIITKAKTVFGEVPGYPSSCADVDIYIDAVGVSSVIEQWQNMAKYGSKLVVVGVHHKPVPINFTLVTYKDAKILGSAGYHPQDVATVFEIMESGKFNLESLITHEFNLKDIVEAIETASKTEESFKVEIKY